MALGLAITLDANRYAARIVLSGIPATADTYSIFRTAPSGNEAGVRGAVDTPVPADTTSLVVRDYEAPFDLQLTYTATVYDGTTIVGTATATFTLVWDDCEAWLVDLARPTNSLPTVIESLRELTFDAATAIHRVLNRRAPVVTSLPAWTPAAELIVLADTLTERDRMRALFGSGYPFLLRTTPDLGIGNLYLDLTSFVEERISGYGYDPQRRFRIACVQVERPDPAIYVPLAPNTYDHVKATYATYAALKAAVGTYDELAYTGGAIGPFVPWLPSDV